MKKLKIGVNTRLLLKGVLEGIPRYTYETLQRLTEQMSDCNFYFFFDRKFDPSFIFNSNVTPIVIAPQARHPLLWKIWFDYSLPTMMRKLEIDVFYSPESYLSLKTDIPSLMVTHDLAFEHFPDFMTASHVKYFQKYSSLFHHKASHIIAVSEFTKQDVMDKYNIPSHQITVAGNACPMGFGPLEEQEKIRIRNKYSGGSPYFIYAGSIHPRKNVIRLVRAFENFKNNHTSNLKLVLAGRLAWKNKEFHSILNASSQKDNIVHLENIKEDFPKLMAGATALFYISMFEGFGIPILEGLQCKIPVVTSKDSSMSEVGGDAVLLVDPKSEEEIVKRMVEIHSGSLNFDRLKIEGAKQIKKYNWDDTTNVIRKSLLDIIKDKK